MDSIDSDTWYQLTETRVDFNSSLQYNGKDIYFALADDNAQQYWQFFLLPNGNYQLRNKGTDVKQLGTCYKSAEKSATKTQPCMIAVSDDRSQQWIIDQWGDGTIKFVNVGNGTNYNMDVHPGNPLFMSAITAKDPIQPAQHWQIQSRMPIDDGTFSTAFGAAAASSSSAPTASPSSSPSSLASSPTDTSMPNSSESIRSTAQAGASQTSNPTTGAIQTSKPQPQKTHGMHTGAAVGIGIGIGLAICISAALFLLLRKRSVVKRNSWGVTEMPTDEMRKGSLYTEGKNDDSAVSVQEVPANAMQERHEMYTEPAEMPGNHEFIEEPWHDSSQKTPSPR